MLYLLGLFIITVFAQCSCDNCQLLDLEYGDVIMRSFNHADLSQIEINIYFADSINFFLIDTPNYLIFSQDYNSDIYYFTSYSRRNSICYSNIFNAETLNYQTGLHLIVICTNYNGCLGYLNFNAKRNVFSSKNKYYIASGVGAVILIAGIIGVIIYYCKKQSNNIQSIHVQAVRATNPPPNLDVIIQPNQLYLPNQIYPQHYINNQ